MQEIKRTSVHDFIYNTIAGTQEISIIGAHNQYVKEPFYEGTPNDLFGDHTDIANELKGWVAGSIWVDNAGVLVITAEGGRTKQWLSDYGKSVANVRASSDLRYSDFKGKIPKKIKDETLAYMDEEGVSLADAFEWACKEYAPKGSELWKAWYYNDFRKFIPGEYDPKYLDFDRYPLAYT